MHRIYFDSNKKCWSRLCRTIVRSLGWIFAPGLCPENWFMAANSKRKSGMFVLGNQEKDMGSRNFDLFTFIVKRGFSRGDLIVAHEICAEELSKTNAPRNKNMASAIAP